MSFQKEKFLEILRNEKFGSEEYLEQYFIEQLPSLLGVSKDRIKNQHTTTIFKYKMSSISDIAVFSKSNKDQAIIAFELKLDETLRKYKESNYEEAKRQLHNYCQDLRCPYGVLLSESKCYIFYYGWDRADTEPIEREYLPSMTEIEAEALGIEERIKKIEKRANDTLIDVKTGVDTATATIIGDVGKWKKDFKIIISCLVAILVIGIGIFFYYKETVDLSCEDIKGNISADGKKIYHTKDSPSYNKTIVTESKGEAYFCTEKEAVQAGFMRWVEYKGN